MCVIYVLCLNIVQLPPGKNQFEVKVNNNKKANEKTLPVTANWMSICQYWFRDLQNDTEYHQMVGCMITDQLKRIWNEPVLI
jgi:hypothetical protein